MYLTLEIEKRDSGNYDIVQREVPDGFLDRQLRTHGIDETAIEEARNNLAKTGKAQVRTEQWVDTFRQAG